jgi:hypothetical protein
MKRAALSSVLMVLSILALAQAPESFNYQVVVRDGSTNPLTDQNVSFRMSILKGSSSGISQYSELHSTNTGALGIVNLVIGNGTGKTGNITTIDWGADTYYLKVEIDKTGGTGYVEMGTTQLLSVPYALHAKTANTHYIGESYGGGIVFYVYDNGQHGLIAATADQSSGIRWYGGSNTITRASADGVGAGKANTTIIIANQGPIDGAAFAATVCNEYSVTVGGVTYGDWYLPSKFELNLLYLQKSVVGGFANTGYWSSTEDGSSFAWGQYFLDGDQGGKLKDYTHPVRAVRSF